MSVSVSSCQSFPLQERLSAFRQRSFIWVGRWEIYAHISAAHPEICFVESHVIRFKYPMCTLTTPHHPSTPPPPTPLLSTVTLNCEYCHRKKKTQKQTTSARGGGGGAS